MWQKITRNVKIQKQKRNQIYEILKQKKIPLYIHHIIFKYSDNIY